MICWMAMNLMAKDTHDSNAASLLSCTMNIESTGRLISRIIPSNRVFQAYIQ